MAIWGSTWAVIRVGLEDVPPFTGVALRFAIAAALLLVLAWQRRVPLGRRPIERRLWLVNGVLSFAVSYCVVYWAEQWIPSGLAAILYATFPLGVAVLAHVWLPGERLTARGFVGLLIGLGGVAWIFSDDLAALGGSEVRLAALVMLASPLASAVANVAVKRWGSGVHPFSLTAVPMALGAFVAACLALLLEGDSSVEWSGTAVGALLYLSLMGSVVTFTLYFWLLEHLPATRLSLITYGVPVVAVVIGVLWLDEPLTLGMVGGISLVLAGVALAAGRRRVAATQPGGVRGA